MVVLTSSSFIHTVPCLGTTYCLRNCGSPCNLRYSTSSTSPAHSLRTLAHTKFRRYNFPMAANHPSYPPLLPRTVFQGSLQPLPRELRVRLTERMQQGRRCQITRGFLAALNRNLLYAAPIAEQQQIHTWLSRLSERQLTQLAQTFTAALRQCNDMLLLFDRKITYHKVL